MKANLNLITLALLAASSSAMAAETETKQVVSYGLAHANTAKVKFAAWKCDRCETNTGTEGTIAVGVGYADADDVHAANTLGTDDTFAYKLNADVGYKSESGYQAEFNALNLGMDSSRAELSAGKAGQYDINLNYRTIKTYTTDDALTPYQGVGGNDLTLPSNWVTAGTTDGMTMLATSLNPVELSLKRERAGIGFNLEGDSLWSTYVDYQRENKTGLKTASGSFFNQSMMLAEPVDYTTDILEAGIKLRGDHWFTALSYSGSVFKNEYSVLAFDNAFNPTFGAQTRGYMALDPDNEAHTVSLAGVYNDGTMSLQGRAYLGQMSQDEPLVTSGYGYQLPAEAVDAQVDLTGIDTRVTYRLTRSLRLQGSYDYYDRDNQTQVEEWTQISINNVNGTVAYNVPYDHSRHRAKLQADYRITSGVKLDGGYEYRRDDRSYQDREVTDENNLWARLNYTSLENWDFRLKADYGMRDGSRFQASELTSTENNELLRRYNLADRQRTAFEFTVTHTPIDTVTLDLSTRYALDDYDETEIGLTESEDFSYDLSLSWQAGKDLLLTAFYGAQTIESQQNGSSNFSGPTWTSDIEDEFSYIGAGARYDNLMADKLTLGVDYNYGDSKSNTQVTQGITGNYGDYYSRSHSLNLYGEYLISEQATLRMDYRMEKYKDNDPANSLAPDDIWNVLSFGNLNHDYNAHLVMVSLQYKL
ncbi:MtrB/PioB family decaheme-associated outer membrane protein [Shewanella submarina]|uniref:MtrB/PioB family decaheme-associated outer membrane protein n=1 Tax=Shewanella submarina TaxID=2016376 RepID=A0ABV7GDK2_9GAMM|nr:MtrB/PioB family decaheme-associated outer membrane protein [Shewanella submarina]MCL1036727.1 MtrB/PioB family decaheme-associated outer membrane protein [Shewanella submarina]